MYQFELKINFKYSSSFLFKSFEGGIKVLMSTHFSLSVFVLFNQHSGSGSESGIRTENLMKSEGVEGSENNDSSNNENDNDSFGLNFKDESDNGSGTQVLFIP